MEPEMMSFEQMNVDDVNWEAMQNTGEINIFQTLPWLNFVMDTQKAVPVITAVKSDTHVLGYFTSLIVKKFGLRILGSPFRGWATYFMGLNLSPNISRREILRALPGYVFGKLGCSYFEIIDPFVSLEELEGLSYKIEHLPWYAIDLSKSEDELFAEMKHQCRTNIRKSIKSGVVIEEACDFGFAEEYYAQYIDVLEKRSLLPAYSLETVRNMIGRLLPTGNMLLLRAKNPEGLCIATGIFLGKNKTGVFWGAASWRAHQSLRPNELLAWQGMTALKARGIQELHFGGECEQYKEKFGCYEAKIYRVTKARNFVLENIINAVTSQKSLRFKNWALRRL
jgi:hypothetical protein